MLSLITGLAFATTAADFMPLTINSKWTYEEKSKSKIKTVDTVMSTHQLNDRQVFLMETTSMGDSIGKAYYFSDGDTFYMAASDLDKPFANPMPLFKVPAPGKTADWDYSERQPHNENKVSLHGYARLAGSKKVNGVSVETLIVHVEALVGSTAPYQQIIQDYTYGKGVGLIESKTVSQIGKVKHETTLKLTTYQLVPPKE